MTARAPSALARSRTAGVGPIGRASAAWEARFAHAPSASQRAWYAHAAQAPAPGSTRGPTQAVPACEGVEFGRGHGA